MKRNTCWQLRARCLRVGRQHQNLSLTHSCCANSCALLGTISIWLRYERIPLDAASEVCYDAGSQHGTFCRWELDVEFCLTVQRLRSVVLCDYRYLLDARNGCDENHSVGAEYESRTWAVDAAS